jgi:hypothetical protein
MSEATQLDNIKCVNAHVFAGLLKTMMACEVSINWEMPDSFIKDAQLNKEDRVRAIVDLLSWKQVGDIKEMGRACGERINTVGDAYDYLLSIMFEAIAEGDYKDLIEATYDCAEDALTYHCYEDWRFIIENAVSEGNFSEDTFLKVVRYLYGGYADELQSLGIEVAL